MHETSIDAFAVLFVIFVKFSFEWIRSVITFRRKDPIHFQRLRLLLSDFEAKYKQVAYFIEYKSNKCDTVQSYIGYASLLTAADGFFLWDEVLLKSNEEVQRYDWLRNLSKKHKSIFPLNSKANRLKKN